MDMEGMDNHEHGGRACMNGQPVTWMEWTCREWTTMDVEGMDMHGHVGNGHAWTGGGAWTSMDMKRAENPKYKSVELT